jgi:hypothetical protein
VVISLHFEIFVKLFSRRVLPYVLCGPRRR